MMNTISGHTGPGCAEIPSPEELDTLKAAAAKAQEAELRWKGGDKKTTWRSARALPDAPATLKSRPAAAAAASRFPVFVARGFRVSAG